MSSFNFFLLYFPALEFWTFKILVYAKTIRGLSWAYTTEFMRLPTQELRFENLKLNIFSGSPFNSSDTDKQEMMHSGV